MWTIWTIQHQNWILLKQFYEGKKGINRMALFKWVICRRAGSLSNAGFEVNASYELVCLVSKPKGSNQIFISAITFMSQPFSSLIYFKKYNFPWKTLLCPFTVFLWTFVLLSSITTKGNWCLVNMEFIWTSAKTTIKQANKQMKINFW